MSKVFEVSQRRILNASVEQVWDAWTRPEAMLQWLSPMGMTTSEVEADVCVGGRYRIAMKQGDRRLPTPPQFGDVLVAEGIYEQLKRPNWLVFTWSWVGWDEISRVRIELNERGEKTELLLVHSRLATEESRIFHDAGWRTTIDSLNAFLEEGSHDPGGKRLTNGCSMALRMRLGRSTNCF